MHLFSFSLCERKSSSTPRSSSGYGWIHLVKSADQLIIVKWCFSYWLEGEFVQEVGGGTACPEIVYEPDPLHLSPSLSLALCGITRQGETLGLSVIHKEATAGHNHAPVRVDCKKKTLEEGLSIYNVGVPQERQGDQNRVVIPQMNVLSLKYFPQDFLNACDPYDAILGDCGTSRRSALAGRSRSLEWVLIEYLKTKVLRIISNTKAFIVILFLIMILFYFIIFYFLVF